MTEAVKLRDITRSKDPMYELCKNRLITPEACDWLKSALDPFHDLQLENLRGFPDVSTEPTVIVKIKQPLAVSKPVGLGAGETWDCHIVLSPIDFSPTLSSTIKAGRATPFGDTGGAPGSLAGEVAIAPGTTFNTGRFDGLLVNSVPSSGANGASQTFTPEHCPSTAAGGYEMQGIHLDDYLDFDATDLAAYRVLYSGFEVVNTTAQIYKQGAVTVYEYGNSFEMGASCPAQITPSTGSVYADKPMSQPTTFFRCPPNTIAEAKIMPAAHSWAASDGCYNTAKFQSDNKFQGVTRRPWVVCQNNPTAPSNGGYKTDADGNFTAGSFVSDITLGKQYTSSSSTRPGVTDMSGPAHFSMMNTTGAYFTGLSSETNLFVTWRIAIERLPAANKPAFLALARPSAAYDPNALVLYNLVANVLPPGCPQGYNDAGKWFRWISEAAQKSIPSVYPVVRTAAMLANAMGRPIIGSALAGLGETMRPVAEKQAAQRMQKAFRKKQGGNPNAKAAVGNWSQPTPRGMRAGGTNGLR